MTSIMILPKNDIAFIIVDIIKKYKEMISE